MYICGKCLPFRFSSGLAAVQSSHVSISEPCHYVVKKHYGCCCQHAPRWNGQTISLFFCSPARCALEDGGKIVYWLVPGMPGRWPYAEYSGAGCWFRCHPEHEGMLAPLACKRTRQPPSTLSLRLICQRRGHHPAFVQGLASRILTHRKGVHGSRATNLALSNFRSPG